MAAHQRATTHSRADADVEAGPGTTGPGNVGPRSATTSRRSILRAGGLGAFGAGFLGAFGAGFLASCGTDDTQAGISGAPRTSTTVTPSVPTTAPNELDRAEDLVQLSTAASLEQLVAEVYGAHGSKLSTSALRDAASDYQSAHVSAAQYLVENYDLDREAGLPNAYVQANLVDPVAATLTTDSAILAFMGQLESSLVAGYLNAVGVLTTAEVRQRVMTFGGAGARRVAVLDSADGGDGAPVEALYPLVDLVPGEAFVGREDLEAAGG